MTTTTSDLAANDQLLKADDYKPLIVSYQNGAAIRLSDVANVQDSVEDLRAAGIANGKPCRAGDYFSPARREYHRYRGPRAGGPSAAEGSIPAAIDLTVVLDQTTTIRASVHDVERTLVISIGLVIIVVFIFLQKCPRNVHSKRGGPGLANRHFRRDVFVSATVSTTCR